MIPRPDSADYAGLLLSGVPFLDSRAPVEFARGAIPGAVNLPLLTDEERAAVGTCYKQRGQAAAIALGEKLVSGDTRAARVAAWQAFVKANPEGYLYCFRGGLRSEIVKRWLKEAGHDYPRVVGGYKALRRFLIDGLETAAARASLIVIAGRTGCGKTRLLRSLPRSLDLEGLARHRGSAFGALLEAQPSQIDFENALSVTLLRLLAADPAPFYVEDEGHLIGRVALPQVLRDRMAAAVTVVVEESVAARVQVVVEDYIIDLRDRYRSALGEGRAWSAHRDRLLRDLDRTRRRLGGARHRELRALMEAAFDEERHRGADAHRGWIERMLVEYYDPMYDYQLSRWQRPCIARGTRHTLAEQLGADRALTG